MQPTVYSFFLSFLSVLLVCMTLNATEMQYDHALKLDAEAEKLIRRGLLLEQFDAFDERTGAILCDFAADYQEVEWVKSKHHGTPFSEDVSQTLDNLALLYGLCHPPLAERYLISMFKIDVHLYGTQSLQAAEVHDRLADFYRVKMADFATAIGHYEEARAIRIDLYGDKDPRITLNSARLARSLFFHRNDEKRMKALDAEAIILRQERPSYRSVPLYEAYWDTGRHMMIHGAFKQAEHYFLKAIETKKADAADHVLILCDLTTAAMNYDEPGQALKYAEEAYKRAKRLDATSHSVLLHAIDTLSEQYTVSAEHERAKRLRNEFNRIKDALLTP
jgi:tetratricopeptide (TPR) repeat protein